jgi:Na+-transporting NADH:ubiquinone oxidoreductase subunit C
LLERFHSMPNDSPAKIVIVALVLCLVCSAFVSVAAVMLRPVQERNAVLEQKRQILRVAGIPLDGQSVERRFERIETRNVNLDTGRYLEGGGAPETDVEPLAPEDDIARIKRRPQIVTVYLVREAGKLETVVLPVYGYGLWSTMYGYISLSGDASTVRGITFYSHGETPGLGGEISSPSWQKRWEGKRVFDDNGEVKLHVVKPGSAGGPYVVDGISGATLTSNGVDHLVQFWLGRSGFGPYLQRLRAKEG